MTNKFDRRFIHYGLLASAPIAMLVAGTPVSAQVTVKQFDIAAQPLSSALLEFSRQSDVLVVVSPEVAAGKRSRALKGSMPVNEAIGRLLQGTKLRAMPSAKGGYVIESDSGASAEGNGGRIGTNSTSSLGEAGASGAPMSTENSQNQAIVVTGTHITGAEPLSKLKVITAQDLQNEGYTRLDQALAQLPENFAGGASEQSNPALAVGPDAINNVLGGSSVDLFGLGAGTTLVLLNGQRLALSAEGSRVDISGIPVSAIERVEILEDGGSALYGADAVGGVVNIITKKDYSGLETGLRLASVSNGKDPNPGANILAGNNWGSGGILADFDYEKDNPLLASHRSFSSDNLQPLYLLPRNVNYRVYVSGHQNITKALEISAQLLYADRKFRNLDNTPFEGLFSYNGEEHQVSGSAELDYKISPDWSVKLTGSYSSDRPTYHATGSAFQLVADSRQRYSTPSASVQMNGRLFDLPGGAVRTAIGADYRHESWDSGGAESLFGNPIAVSPRSGKRTTYSFFGEVLIPLVSAANGVALVRELTIDVAGRYDHYSDFGSTANPKISLKWMPSNDLAIRGTYATSFKAPLFEQLYGQRYAYLYPQVDPTSPSGYTPILLLDGMNPALKPEKSRSYTTGLDYNPSWAAGLHLSINFFHFNYTDRIEQLGTTLPLDEILADASLLGPSLFTLDPTITEVNDAIASVPAGNVYNYGVYYQGAPYSVDQIKAIAQIGFVNAAKSVVSGFLPAVHYDIDTRYGRISPAFDATWFTKYENSITQLSQPYSFLNEVAQPLRFRAKASLSWQYHNVGAYIRVNYSNRYRDKADPSCPSNVGCRVASWTTVDVGASVKTSNADDELTRNVRVGLYVQNLFGLKPPYAYTPSNVGTLKYDPINANPLERTFSLTLTKKW